MSGREVSDVLFLNIKKGYFEEIRDGIKPYEFRLDNLYWQKRLNKDFVAVEFRCGYPKTGDKERIIRRKWMGYKKMTICHVHFGKDSVDVFAIRTDGEEI